ncbi:MAG TPA: hypothetical protein VFX20_15445 [Steroidobacteraceae bacterium]|nr:hypothetical protein [Steroidobacteraceae bacterium]
MMDEDQDWLDALAGRAAGGRHPTAIREAQRLRECIQRNVSTPHVAVPARDAQREAQLLERAQREGLIDPVRLASRRRLLLAPTKAGGWVALAAGLVGIAAALALFLRGTPQSAHLRSGHENVSRIEAADPKALKMELLDELRAAGVPATGYEALGVEGIDAQVPQPVSPRVRDILIQHHVSVPGNGILRIEIAAQGAPPP